MTLDSNARALRCAPFVCLAFVWVALDAPEVYAQVDATLPDIEAAENRTAVAPTSTEGVRIEVLGLRRVGEAQVREWIGTPPARARDWEEWSAEAVNRVVAELLELGYSAARGWASVQGRTIYLDIDEGVIDRMVFVGAGSYDAFLLSDNVVLPSDVLFEPDLAEQLVAIAARYEMERVPWRIADGARYKSTALGLRVPERVLLIRIYEEEEGRGFDFDVSGDSQWGLLLGLVYEDGPALGPSHHLHTGLRVGVPVHQYLFEHAPSARWVYGDIFLRYTFDTFGDSHLAPSLLVQSSAPLLERPDQDVAGVIMTRSFAETSLRLRIDSVFEVALGAGLRVIDVLHVEPLPDTPAPDLTSEPVVLRPLARLWTRWTPDDSTLRLDLRDYLEIDLHAGGNTRESLLFGVVLRDRLVGLFSWGALLLSQRGVFLTGDVRFYDEVELAGDFLRTYFEDRYWVREAAQVEGAIRFTVSSDFDVGLFADLAVFGDRTQEGAPLRLATSFGPSIHAILVDQFAFDLYYGFGFAPVGFDHSLQISFESFY